MSSQHVPAFVSVSETLLLKLPMAATIIPSSSFFYAFVSLPNVCKGRVTATRPHWWPMNHSVKKQAAEKQLDINCTVACKYGMKEREVMSNKWRPNVGSQNSANPQCIKTSPTFIIQFYSVYI